MQTPAIKSAVAVFFLFFLFTQGGHAAVEDEACLHNVVRDALNTGKTMRNLGPRLDETYNFSQQNQPAIDLPEMSNSAALRASAASWASQCRFEHSGWSGKGENLFVGTETYLDPAKWATDRKWSLINAINDWAYEVRLLTVGWVATTCEGGSSSCGHYTQMMWDDTTDVGCASQFCPTVTQNGSPIFSGRQSTLVVCHYSPQGNYINQSGNYLAPYTIGGSSSSNAAPLDCSEGGEPPPEEPSTIDIGPILQLLL